MYNSPIIRQHPDLPPQTLISGKLMPESVIKTINGNNIQRGIESDQYITFHRDIVHGTMWIVQLESDHSNATILPNPLDPKRSLHTLATDASYKLTLYKLDTHSGQFTAVKEHSILLSGTEDIEGIINPLTIGAIDNQPALLASRFLVDADGKLQSEISVYCQGQSYKIPCSNDAVVGRRTYIIGGTYFIDENCMAFTYDANSRSYALHEATNAESANIWNKFVVDGIIPKQFSYFLSDPDLSIIDQ